MACVEEFQYMADTILPFLERPPSTLKDHREQHAYLAASLEFAYTAVELVEAQLERNLRAAQDGLDAAATEEEILEMERNLLIEQSKMDHMKTNCRMRSQRIIEAKHAKYAAAGRSPTKASKNRPPRPELVHT
ncbi:hypothetical protein H0H87_012017 [Tephrocybe sp. NHM501043]|nr:hypothetical protein H0H87_012017 [Tephrocybe sp. NHM501043]